MRSSSINYKVIVECYMYLVHNIHPSVRHQILKNVSLLEDRNTMYVCLVNPFLFDLEKVEFI